MGRVRQLGLPGLDEAVESLTDRRKRYLFVGLIEAHLEALRRMRKAAKAGEPLDFDAKLMEMAEEMQESAAICHAIGDAEAPMPPRASATG